eukprot:1862824-Rhodomonas_salina.1
MSWSCAPREIKGKATITRYKAYGRKAARARYLAYHRARGKGLNSHLADSSLEGVGGLRPVQVCPTCWLSVPHVRRIRELRTARAASTCSAYAIAVSLARTTKRVWGSKAMARREKDEGRVARGDEKEGTAPKERVKAGRRATAGRDRGAGQRRTVAEHHGGGEDGGERVRLVRACNVRRRA